MPGLNSLEDSGNLRGLPWMLAISQVAGIAMVVMIGVWLNTYLGGFAWDGGPKEFNLHPLCMICGMVFLYGEAALVYRVFRNSRKLKVKLIHAGLLFLAFFAIIIGLVAVFSFHRANNIANLYSLHSWCGITTVIMFCFQLLLGFLTFLFPGARSSLRSTYLPIHQFFGGAILVLAAISSISGINEKLFFVYAKDPKNPDKVTYPQLPGGAVFGNVCGLVVVAFVFLILFIIQRSEWKRPTDPEEEALSIHFRRVVSQGSEDSG
ncbi:transmembrane ascorbate-dependent reductase CYB561-like [Clavelina lepadiformis]|uniref:Cytochrome b561 domain-containing protein n=1 Tax=Clavelina lepadiformis TaxID=159417 RepID=A0ABP0FRR0_CLALP